eukprot:571162-Rhodomonas_salina.1
MTYRVPRGPRKGIPTLVVIPVWSVSTEAEWCSKEAFQSKINNQNSKLYTPGKENCVHLVPSRT